MVDCYFLVLTWDVALGWVCGLVCCFGLLVGLLFASFVSLGLGLGCFIVLCVDSVGCFLLLWFACLVFGYLCWFCGLHRDNFVWVGLACLFLCDCLLGCCYGLNV